MERTKGYVTVDVFQCCGLRGGVLAVEQLDQPASAAASLAILVRVCARAMTLGANSLPFVSFAKRSAAQEFTRCMAAHAGAPDSGDRER